MLFPIPRFIQRLALRSLTEGTAAVVTGVVIAGGTTEGTVFVSVLEVAVVEEVEVTEGEAELFVSILELNLGAEAVLLDMLVEVVGGGIGMETGRGDTFWFGGFTNLGFT